MAMPAVPAHDLAQATRRWRRLLAAGAGMLVLLALALVAAQDAGAATVSGTVKGGRAGRAQSPRCSRRARR
jgi:hypothetical protein